MLVSALYPENNVVYGIVNGKVVCDSKSGASGAWHNPFVIVTEQNADNFSGDSYGFNLIYSGNHRSVCEKSPYDGVRFLNGILPDGFRFDLQKGEMFFYT